MEKGWGVVTLENISKGTFVCEYVGEVITASEATKYLFDFYSIYINFINVYNKYPFSKGEKIIFMMLWDYLICLN